MHNNKSQSKYKQSDIWDNHYTGYGYYYKPKYDLSASLAARVTQLIKTITGKSLKLVNARGWGCNDQYFFYNASDLVHSTDDEVLARILHQLARQLFLNLNDIESLNQKEPDYRHLLATLEDNRADAQLQKMYGGCKYYATELWENRKWIDNPVLRYSQPMSIENWANFNLQSDLLRAFLEKQDSGLVEKIERSYEEYLQSIEGEKNDSWEFCFNINAVQNGEVEFDFLKDEVLSKFVEAVPYIQQYLDAPTFAEAMAVYPEIKKRYPIPDKNQQNQMDNSMQGSESLTKSMMEQMARDELEREMSRNGIDATGLLGSQGGDKDIELENNLKLYQEVKGKHQSKINNLAALIRSILKDNALKRFQRPFKRGVLDAKRIYKLLATDNLRIFKKQRVVSDKDYTMAIVVDQSGSMEGNNSKYAVEGAVILTEVFEQLGLSYEILGFSDNPFIFKEFSKPVNKAIIPCLDADYAGSGTNDLGALELLHEHMRNFDPSTKYRKGVFVITDGEGADPMRTKDLVKKMEGEHNATVFGIGIGGVSLSNLQSVYNSCLQVDDIEELPTQLIGLMRSQFKRN